MRVLVDLKVLSTEAALRGMGRYTQQQIFEALRADPNLEIFLLLQEQLDPARCLYDWLTMPRVHPVSLELGDGLPSDSQLDHEKLMFYAHRLQALLRHLSADLFHNATPFLLPYYTAITRVPVVSTAYDFIPLIFPQDYFSSIEDRDNYYRMLRNVRASDRVAAISRSAATDLRLYTGYPAERIDVAYPFVEAAFRHNAIDSERRAAARAALRAAMPQLPMRFIASVTGIHRSKNVAFLLDCLGDARQHPRWTGLPLVIVLPSAWALEHFRDKFSIPKDTVVVADVSETILRDIYIAAEFVFQPSLYEGFGYPVAEAMHCGAAVIATRTASIPEIAGDAAILVDPTDRHAGAAAMLHLATDERALAKLRGAAPARAAMFGNPMMLGEATVRCWQAAAATAAAPPRRRVALWSSMPPLDCGIADYTAELADALANEQEVDVYTDGKYMPAPRAAPNIHFRHVRDFDASEPGLTHRIFQLQAREYQAFMYREILEHGGTIMLHDITLSHAFYSLARHFGRYAEFEDRMLAPEGPDAVRDFKAALSRSGGVRDSEALATFFDRYRLLRWAVGGSNQVLTHTYSLARELLHDYPDAQVRVVRQGYSDRLPLVRHLPLPLWRHRLEVGPHGLIVGVFGIVGRNKRIEQAINAFEGLWRVHADSLLIIVGSNYDRTYGKALEARISTSPAARRIVMVEYLPSEIYHGLIALSDVLINLRWPALGGLSAVLLRGLAAGKPVIVSDIPDWREVGEEACLRVAPDEEEVEGITSHLLRLAADPSERARLGRVARSWFAQEATPAIMVADHIFGGRKPASACEGASS